MDKSTEQIFEKFDLFFWQQEIEQVRQTMRVPEWVPHEAYPVLLNSLRNREQSEAPHSAGNLRRSFLLLGEASAPSFQADLVRHLSDPYKLTRFYMLALESIWCDDVINRWPSVSGVKRKSKKFVKLVRELLEFLEDAERDDDVRNGSEVSISESPNLRAVKRRRFSEILWQLSGIPVASFVHELAEAADRIENAKIEPGYLASGQVRTSRIASFEREKGPNERRNFFMRSISQFFRANVDKPLHALVAEITNVVFASDCPDSIVDVDLVKKIEKTTVVSREPFWLKSKQAGSPHI